MGGGSRCGGGGVSAGVGCFCWGGGGSIFDGAVVVEWIARHFGYFLVVSLTSRRN